MKVTPMQTSVGKTDTPPKARARAEYLKAFRFSSVAGAAFGTVIAVLFQWQGISPWPAALFLPVCAAVSAIVAGLAGIAATYLEKRLARMGLRQPTVRAAISFIIVASVVFGITALTVPLSSLDSVGPEVRRYAGWGWALGLGFGAIFQMTSLRTELLRQRMQLLEMENEHLAALAEREKLLREAARNLAVAEERNRMARELHDSISQGVHGIVYSLRSLRPVVKGNPQGEAIVEHLEETAAATLQELRHMVSELAPSPVEEKGLVDALHLHCDLFTRRQNIALNLRLDYDGGLHPEQEAAVYRIVQEALTNIQRHAEASRVEVALTQDNGSVLLTIRDDGCGFDVANPAKGHGLRNMATRAAQAGGTLHISSEPGTGTTLTLRLPQGPSAQQALP